MRASITLHTIQAARALHATAGCSVMTPSSCCRPGSHEHLSTPCAEYQVRHTGWTDDHEPAKSAGQHERDEEQAPSRTVRHCLSRAEAVSSRLECGKVCHSAERSRGPAIHPPVGVMGADITAVQRRKLKINSRRTPGGFRCCVSGGLKVAAPTVTH